MRLWVLCIVYSSKCVSSNTTYRYGEIVNINLVRDKKTGKSQGYCFIAYEDQRSTILAVDNFNGIQVNIHCAVKTDNVRSGSREGAAILSE